MMLRKTLFFIISASLFLPTIDASSGNIVKDAKKAAGELKADGWKTVPGQTNMENQVLMLYIRQSENDDSVPRYIIGSRTVRERDFSSARKHSLSLARADVAAQLESKVSSLTESVSGSKTLPDGEVETAESIMSSAKTLIQQHLGLTEVVMELYRELPDRSIEVRIFLSYDTKHIKDELAKLREGEIK